MLQLPPELRIRIWGYVLGGNLLRCDNVRKHGSSEQRIMVPVVASKELGMDLLRTCRQIYAETALLPYQLNTFCFDNYCWIKDHTEYLKPFQLAQITYFELDIIEKHGIRLSYLDQNPVERLAKNGRYNLKFLPAVKHIRVLIFSKHVGSDIDVEVCKANVRNQLTTLLAGRELSITFEVHDMTRTDYLCQVSYPNIKAAYRDATLITRRQP